MRDSYNIIPMFLAVALHVVLLGALIVAIDFSRAAQPQMPLAISATLIAESAMPKPRKPEPEPEPEPEQVPVEEPEREDPDEAAERLRQEEEKRQADLRAEQERIRLQQEADRKRRAAEEAEQKRRREEELERQRVEAERKREEDIERQRRENERLRVEAEVKAEAERQAAMQANDEQLWVFAIRRAITRNFIRPASAPEKLQCIVNVKQLPGGQVVNVSIGRCNGDEAVRRAIIAAVNKASPLPSPDNPSIFQRDLTLDFSIEQ